MSIVVDSVPKEMWITGDSISFDMFAKKLAEYMEDLEDREVVKEEINKKSKSFDYDVIRWDYV